MDGMAAMNSSALTKLDLPEPFAPMRTVNGASFTEVDFMLRKFSNLISLIILLLQPRFPSTAIRF